MAKRITTITEDIIRNDHDERYGEYLVEFRGLMQHMKKDCHFAHAIFGTFEQTGNGTVLYSASVGYENGEIYHNPHSELLDDLRWLQDGHCNYFN